MKMLKILGLSLCTTLVAGSALAAQLPEVKVMGEDANALVISCSNPSPPSKEDVNRILHVTSTTQTMSLRNKLLEAAAEACQAGEPRILVQRTASGKLTWKAMPEEQS